MTVGGMWNSFDATFFGYSEADATLLDPQLRVLHECSWQAFEDAGYAPDGELGRVGVYIGGCPDWEWRCAAQRPLRAASPGLRDANDAFASCLSYRFGLQGPSLTLQASSSSSLVAVHVASRAIVAGECDMAVAGGVDVRMPIGIGQAATQAGEVPPVPCRAFDAEAHGSVSANGCGVVVLKALPEAIADGDYIYAVVLGTATNNDGQCRLDYCAPSVMGQRDVICRAHDVAGVKGEALEYVEAHGSGSPLGDAVEIEALTQAFHTDRRQFCAIGSIKTNIGNLNHAGGIAAFIKAVMVVHDGVLPPTLHYRRSNPRIDFAATPFVVNTRLRMWESRRRRAGVNAIGIGGTNAYAVIEDAPRAPRRTASDGRSHLVVLSARQAAALDGLTARLRDAIQSSSEIDIGDVASTLRLGRARLPHRRAMLCRDRRDAVEVLRGLSPERVWSGVSSSPVRLTFVLPGDARRYPLTDCTLYDRLPAFRTVIDMCLEKLAEPLRAGAADVLGVGPKGGARSGDIDPLSAQSALFVHEYAYATLLKDIGVQPSALLGAGIGDLVAGCIAEVFRLEDALSLIVKRVHADRGDTALAEYASAVMAIDRQPPVVPILSRSTAQATEVSYWVDRLRQPWSLSDGIATLLRMPPHVLVDVGPDGRLERSARNTSPAPAHIVISLGGDTDDDESRLWRCLGQVWTRGVDITWARVSSGDARRIPLPTYEFGGNELPDTVAAAADA
jgi:phthiocerol/phenolphthiocerol synthesis type-I polyketide synthase E